MWNELRTAGRGLIRAPSFSLVAVATLALGIGANTAIFSVADVLLFRGLPYPEPDELVAVWLDRSGRDGTTRAALSGVDLDALDAEPSLFQAIAGSAPWNPTLSEREGVSVVPAASVTEGMFGRVLGVQPVLGRTFRTEEHLPDGTRTALISDEFWTEHFARDPGVLGRAVSLDDVPYTVVGVMPASFRAPFSPSAEVWTPMLDGSGPPGVEVIARLAPGVSPAVARERARVAGDRAAESWPGALVGVTLSVADLRTDLLGPTPLGLRLLLAAFGLLLFASCANTAALLITRRAARHREAALRLALGGQGNVWRRLQILEGAILCTVGAGLGVGGAAWVTELLFELAPLDATVFAEPGVDGRVLAWSIALTLLCTALVAGLGSASSIPASPRLAEARAARRSGDAIRVVFIGTQVACAVALLTGAGLLFRSMEALDRIDLGYDPDGRYAIAYDPPDSRLTSPDAARAFYARIATRLSRLPGAVTVAAATATSPGASPQRLQIRIDDPAALPGGGGFVPGTRVTGARSVGPGYFYAVGQRTLDGRTFDELDGPEAAEVVVVSETLAHAFDWPRTSPIGRRLRVIGDGPQRWRTVVGVVADVRPSGPRSTPVAEIYLPVAQAPSRAMVLVAHIDGPRDEVLRAIQSAVHHRDDPAAPRSVTPLEEEVAEANRPERFAARLLLALSMATLMLAAVGVYSVVGQRVTGRVRELGIRRALGASAEELRALVTTRVLRLVLLGSIVGAAAGIRLTDFIESLLFGVSRVDPIAIAGAWGILLLTAAAAAGLPARRVTRIDPMHIMREE